GRLPLRRPLRAGVRRPRLHAHERGGAVPARAARRPDLGGHVRDPAADRGARPREARRGADARHLRDLTPLFAPRSVALVGASNDRMKWGGWFAISLLGQAGHPPISMGARGAGDVFGRQGVPSLLDLDEAPDLAILSIPAAAVEGAVAEAV